jgi:hypothetical protein
LRVHKNNILTHLVKVLQQVDYPALDLILGQASGGRVEADALRDKARSELSSNGGAADLEGGRGLDGGTGDGGPQGADNGGAEHGESVVSNEHEGFESRRKRSRRDGGGRRERWMKGDGREEREEDGRK